MLIAMGAACFDRYARAMRQAERMTVELEQRVAEKAQEIEEDHARLDEALREHTLAEERQRILADMHDGLGASFVSLLHYLDSRNAAMTEVKRRAEEALKEMRVAIAALQPHGSEITSVLASLRERVDGLVAERGARLVWQVDELPPVEGLGPSTVFSLQRIVLEAAETALAHSGAQELRVIARSVGSGGVEIRIEDDGRGFDPELVRAGPGLADMRARAQRIGARLEIASRSERGTVVQLTLLRPPPKASIGREGAATEAAQIVQRAPATHPA